MSSNFTQQMTNAAVAGFFSAPGIGRQFADGFLGALGIDIDHKMTPFVALSCLIGTPLFCCMRGPVEGLACCALSCATSCVIAQPKMEKLARISEGFRVGRIER